MGQGNVCFRQGLQVRHGLDVCDFNASPIGQGEV